MNRARRLESLSIWIILALALAACGKQEQAPAPAEQAPAPTASAPATGSPPAAQETVPAETQQAPATAPAEDISETDEPAESAQASSTQPSLKLSAAPAAPATSSQFREGAQYQRIVPAQPTTVGPGKVEVAEVFWYGCGHCFSLDPAIESWRSKNKAPYVELVRTPAMWNDITRMHARVFYTAELLGKLEAVHTLIFREIHVNGNPLNTVEKVAAFFKQQGVSPEEFNKAFSSFAVENKLQRADFLNRRYRIESVPTFIVNGKYKTDVGDAGGEAQLFTLINELAAHEQGG
jgi:protein dithiol oxidoreductase (disulfide-forming)